MTKQPVSPRETSETQMLIIIAVLIQKYFIMNQTVSTHTPLHSNNRPGVVLFLFVLRFLHIKCSESGGDYSPQVMFAFELHVSNQWT